MDELEKFRARRNQAFRDLDLEWARTMIPDASSDFVRLLALHKARLDCVDIEPELRRESARWLLANGFKGMHGETPDPNNLPI